RGGAPRAGLLRARAPGRACADAGRLARAARGRGGPAQQGAGDVGRGRAARGRRDHPARGRRRPGARRPPAADGRGPRRRSVKRAALYAGGYLGPFGGGVIAVLIPELRHAYHATTGEVTAGITAYLVPFAALQVVSGTLGARLG